MRACVRTGGAAVQAQGELSHGSRGDGVTEESGKQGPAPVYNVGSFFLRAIEGF